jgi:hypothetical protein
MRQNLFKHSLACRRVIQALIFRALPNLAANLAFKYEAEGALVAHRASFNPVRERIHPFFINHKFIRLSRKESNLQPRP